MTRSVDENLNRTGGAMNPEGTRELTELAAQTPPSSPGDGRLLTKMRESYFVEGRLMGHVPRAKGTGRAKNAGRRALLLDKMGERLTFERSGTRVWEALLAKYDAPAPIGPERDAPPRRDLEHICGEEHAHFQLMTEALVSMGADPTAMTPAANVAATISCGIPKVLLDPRSTFMQCLDAVLVAELTDNEGWQLLVELAHAEGLDELAERFSEARDAEAEHLAKVRSWIATASLAGGSPTVHG